MKSVDYYFDSYSAYHTTKGNKVTHYLGIPLIVFSTFGLLAFVKITDAVNLALILWIVGSLFYLKLDWKKGLPFVILMYVVYWASLWVSWQAHLALFIFGWILQGIGHYKYEKKSPAFLTNFEHLLIGPFWIFCRLFKK